MADRPRATASRDRAGPADGFGGAGARHDLSEGSGSGRFGRGERVVSHLTLEPGDVLVVDDERFDASNVAVVRAVADGSEPGFVGFKAVFADSYDPSRSRQTGDQEFAVWDFVLADGEQPSERYFRAVPAVSVNEGRNSHAVAHDVVRLREYAHNDEYRARMAERLVAEGRADDPGYDLASAEAALDSMLDDGDVDGYARLFKAAVPDEPWLDGSVGPGPTSVGQWFLDV